MDQLYQTDAEARPIRPPRAERYRLAEEESENRPSRRTERHQQADLTRPFGDGDGHDGDDADAADEQRDAAQRADRHGRDVEDLASVRSMSSCVVIVKSSRPWQSLRTSA